MAGLSKTRSHKVAVEFSAEKNQNRKKNAASFCEAAQQKHLVFGRVTKSQL